VRSSSPTKTILQHDHLAIATSCDVASGDGRAPKTVWRYAYEPRELLRWIQTRIDLLFTMSENSQAFAMKAGEYKSRGRKYDITTRWRRRQARFGDPSGGARRDRTDDLMLAKHALSQLSYGPVTRRRMLRSIEWWAWEDLNFRPHAYQARALTN
jgi:hypothetical protein